MDYKILKKGVCVQGAKYCIIVQEDENYVLMSYTDGDKCGAMILGNVAAVKASEDELVAWSLAEKGLVFEQTEYADPSGTVNKVVKFMECVPCGGLPALVYNIKGKCKLYGNLLENFVKMLAGSDEPMKKPCSKPAA